MKVREQERERERGRLHWGKTAAHIRWKPEMSNGMRERQMYGDMFLHLVRILFTRRDQVRTCAHVNTDQLVSWNRPYREHVYAMKMVTL